MFVKQCKCVKRLISDSRMKFCADTIKDNSSNPRILFSTFEKLLHLKAAPKLPSHENDNDLANTFAESSENKIVSLSDNMLKVILLTHFKFRPVIVLWNCLNFLLFYEIWLGNPICWLQYMALC